MSLSNANGLPTMVGIMVIGSVGFLFLLGILFKGKVHF